MAVFTLSSHYQRSNKCQNKYYQCRRRGMNYSKSMASTSFRPLFLQFTVIGMVCSSLHKQPPPSIRQQQNAPSNHQSGDIYYERRRALCEPPPSGCGYGIWHTESCQCMCLPPYCFDDIIFQSCITVGDCANPFQECTPHIDCPFFPDTFAGNCRSEPSIPQGVFEVFWTEVECCQATYPNDSSCVQNVITSPPTFSLSTSPTLTIANLTLQPTTYVPHPVNKSNIDEASDSLEVPSIAISLLNLPSSFQLRHGARDSFCIIITDIAAQALEGSENNIHAEIISTDIVDEIFQDGRHLVENSRIFSGITQSVSPAVDENNISIRYNQVGEYVTIISNEEYTSNQHLSLGRSPHNRMRNPRKLQKDLTVWVQFYVKGSQSSPEHLRGFLVEKMQDRINYFGEMLKVAWGPDYFTENVVVSIEDVKSTSQQSGQSASVSTNETDNEGFAGRRFRPLWIVVISVVVFKVLFGAIVFWQRRGKEKDDKKSSMNTSRTTTENEKQSDDTGTMRYHPHKSGGSKKKRKQKADVEAELMVASLDGLEGNSFFADDDKRKMEQEILVLEECINQKRFEEETLDEGYDGGRSSFLKSPSGTSHDSSWGLHRSAAGLDESSKGGNSVLGLLYYDGATSADESEEEGKCRKKSSSIIGGQSDQRSHRSGSKKSKHSRYNSNGKSSTSKANSSRKSRKLRKKRPKSLDKRTKIKNQHSGHKLIYDFGPDHHQNEHENYSSSHNEQYPADHQHYQRRNQYHSDRTTSQRSERFLDNENRQQLHYDQTYCNGQFSGERSNPQQRQYYSEECSQNSSHSTTSGNFEKEFAFRQYRITDERRIPKDPEEAGLVHSQYRKGTDEDCRSNFSSSIHDESLSANSGGDFIL